MSDKPDNEFDVNFDESSDDEDNYPSQEEIDVAIKDLMEVLDNIPAAKIPAVLVNDLSDRFPADEKLHRIELRVCLQTAKLPDRNGNKAAGERYLIGLLPESDLPMEGEPFKLHYHNLNGAVDFDYLNTGAPVSKVTKQDTFIYFTAGKSECAWNFSTVETK